VQLHAITRHILGLFHAQPGGRNWRRILSEKGGRHGASIDVIEEAKAAVSPRDEAA
jgi:tRNA-dihydrouridine synthase A